MSQDSQSILSMGSGGGLDCCKGIAEDVVHREMFGDSEEARSGLDDDDTRKVTESAWSANVRIRD